MATEARAAACGALSAVFTAGAGTACKACVAAEAAMASKAGKKTEGALVNGGQVIALVGGWCAEGGGNEGEGDSGELHFD
jgi:hypothetical protein